MFRLHSVISNRAHRSEVMTKVPSTVLVNAILYSPGVDRNHLFVSETLSSFYNSELLGLKL